MPLVYEPETPTFCDAAVDRVVSEVLSSKDGGGTRVLGKRIIGQLVLIKDNIYSFSHSINMG